MFAQLILRHCYLQAEFLGTLLFVFASSTVSSALAIGMAYSVASYATASAHYPDCGNESAY